MCFLIKILFYVDKKITFICRFIVSNRNFTTEYDKIVKYLGFSRFTVKWQPFI